MGGAVPLPVHLGVIVPLRKGHYSLAARRLPTPCTSSEHIPSPSPSCLCQRPASPQREAHQRIIPSTRHHVSSSVQPLWCASQKYHLARDSNPEARSFCSV